ncbi:MAG TPA: hypothetical protein VHW23_00390 [Kofleriaceae bacterium]|nr:hypothetical protein [Kofleriaceae bacterium]
MRFLGVALGLTVLGACNGELGDADATSAPAFDQLRGGYHGDRGGHARAVRRALEAAAARLAALQADTIGDNARNGVDDADPDDGGWDFIVAPTATEHSAGASPTNIFGATALGAWAAIESRSAGHRALTAALDAGLGMQRNPDVDSAPDVVFGVLLAELADNHGFADIARAHYDAKRASRTDAAGLGVFIRDARHAANEDGLIPYDVGWFVLAAAALDSAFPSAGYDRDASTYAGIVVDDLTSATPDFDFRDPAEAFYGTGLAWSLVSSAWLRDNGLFRDVRAQLLGQQHADGAWGTSAAQPGDDLQVTAHALQTLALTDESSAGRRAEQRAARFLLRAQAASGGWVDATNHELPLVDADIALGLMLSRTEAGEDGLIPDAPLAVRAATGAPNPAAPLP